MYLTAVKGIAHPKMEMVRIYFPLWNIKYNIFEKLIVFLFIQWKSMVCFVLPTFFKYILCSAEERKLHRFGMT